VNEIIYCYHNPNNPLLKEGYWKMDKVNSRESKCSCCDARLIIETYVCPLCNREIELRKEFDSPYEKQWEEHQGSLVNQKMSQSTE
jgi:hypothetical protein